MTTPEQRREVIELAEKATPRPYELRSNVPFSLNGLKMFSGRFESNYTIAEWCNKDYGNDQNNINYIVAACNLAPDLAREVEELRAKIEKAPHAMDCRFLDKNDLCGNAIEEACQRVAPSGRRYGKCYRHFPEDYACNCWKAALAAGKETK